jgi:4,5-DOPA dioxygenase extradiol
VPATGPRRTFGADRRAWSASDQERRARASYRAPALFISHGSPLVVMNEAYKRALRRFGVELRDPKGLIVLSAHWQSMRPLRVTSARRPATVQDCEGFPSWVDSLSWKGEGSPALAERVVGALSTQGLSAQLDASRGFDTGVWVPLSLMYPNGRSPVVQVSLPTACSPADLCAVGAALAPLRSEGYMLVGSGGTVHNPSRVRFDRHDPPTEAWAVAFDNWVRDRLETLDVDALRDYRAKGPQAHLAAPTSEHIDPMFVVLGAALPGDCPVPIFEGFHAGNLSLRTFALMGRRAADKRLPDDLVAAAGA